MKVGVCGAWHVHAKDYTKEAKMLGHEVVAVYDEDFEFASQLAKTFELNVCSSLNELLSMDIEAVIVCTATNAHKEYIIQIANAKKHIYCEKVLALTCEDCEEIKEAVSRNGIRFTISFPWKTNSLYITAKQLVENGEIGRINFMRFRKVHDGALENWLPSHFFNREQCGGGAMIDLGCHGMYLTEWFLGMPTSAKSIFTKVTGRAVEDNAVTIMSFQNGAIAVNETGFVSKMYPTVLEIGGEKGTIIVEDEVKLCKDDECRVIASEKMVPSPLAQFLTGLENEDFNIERAIALTKMMIMAYAD